MNSACDIADDEVVIAGVLDAGRKGVDIFADHCKINQNKRNFKMYTVIIK